jgi:ABC-type nitrate/sulfonate/bicarbonate transport system substrate-binding protein
MTLMTGSKAKPLRIGFVPLTDCAPLVVAKETGLFGRYDLEVSLSRELGWASIRDKLCFGELDAAHALAALLFGAQTLPGYERRRCVTGVVLSLNGDGITLSNRLWNVGARDAVSFREYLLRQRKTGPTVLGVPALLSSHYFLLRQWLAAAKIDFEQGVRIVTLPPQQMSGHLKSGHLDGYCVGEPWNSVAIREGAGWCAATSGEIFPLHPEKALLVSEQFAEDRHEEHLRLIAALVEACLFCDQSGNLETVVALLALPQYVNVPVETLRNGFSGSFDYGHGKREDSPDFAIFSRYEANIPSYDKAAWLTRQIARSGLAPAGFFPAGAVRRSAFRPDLFQQAMELVSKRSICL